MSDEAHLDSKPSAHPYLTSWERHAVFRETFLSLLPVPEAEAFRLLGRRLYHNRHENIRPSELAGLGVSTIRRELASAVEDLEVLAGFLSSIGDGLEPSLADQGLVRKCRESASVAAQLAARLVGALGAESSSGQRLSSRSAS